MYDAHQTPVPRIMEFSNLLLVLQINRIIIEINLFSRLTQLKFVIVIKKNDFFK